MLEIDGRNVGAACTLRPDQKAQGIPAHWRIYISVANADATASLAAAAGATVLAPPFDVMGNGRMAVIQDPTGAIFCLWQPQSHQGTGITNVNGSVVWADLNTHDAARAKQFYSDVFGWNIQPGQADESGYLHIQNGKDFIGGIPGPGQIPPDVPPHWMLYFQVADCDASAEKLKQLGGRVFMGPMTLEKVGRFAVVEDPQGASFAIFQPLPH